ncbi:PREDICTED: uncharacterized protein LOC106748829 [Dinoponera quadriceps]|uniref:Uncharacterized protein LOC106748829 n=1 Tax=Dinoponera quadriceps TaxID=609295 RepID=A0A6P3XXC6_DINQU|nr:PREDICTED: uncharacterized protein LOC106748829 [Dinoponera quadriceps]
MKNGGDSQDVAFDLEKYGPYIDKIRALFVPSLEYRIHSFLVEFVYSTDSRSARRFPRFKRFVDTLATWKGLLNKIAEYDVETMGEAIGSIMNCALKDDLITCFLDSVILHHRLSKICRELDALGIEDNILRSLNVWNFASERNYRRPDGADVAREFPIGGKTQAASRLKVIVRKMHVEDCGCSTGSSVVTRHLPVPCRADDLIRRISEADPSLTESCLIVMRRKFQISVGNVCSCLNDVLGKPSVETSRPIARTLRLEIRPGYISFKLKAAGVRNCLFVARIPICQKVRTSPPRDLRVTSPSANAKGPRGAVEGSECPGWWENADFNDTLSRIDEESERTDDDACCSRPGRKSPAAVDSPPDGRLGSDGAEESALSPSINENLPNYDDELTTCPCDELSEPVVETVSDVSTGEPEKRNEEHRETPGSCVIDYDGDTEEHRKGILESDDSIEESNKPVRSADDGGRACSSYDLANHDQTGGISSDSDGLSRIMDFDGREWTRPSNKESDSGSADCANASSIATFVRNPERDKQLVELNYNCFSAVVKADDERSSDPADSLNSAGVELGPDCSRCYDDFVDITIAGDGASTRLVGPFRGKSYATKVQPRATDYSLAISARTPRLRVSSKDVNVDCSVTSCSDSDHRSDVRLPWRGNLGERRNEGGMKPRRRSRLAGGSEVLPKSFRSIDAAWSHDLSTPAATDSPAKWELEDGRRRRRKAGKRRGGLVNYDGNFHRGGDPGDHGTSVTISSIRSAASSFVDDDPAGYLGQRDAKRGRNRRTISEERQHRVGRCGDEGRRRKPRALIGKVDEFSEISSSSSSLTSFVKVVEARDARGRSYGAARSRNAAGSSSFKGEDRREIARSRGRRVPRLPADTCRDCTCDLELDFESALSRYVELCRNVKRSLMRTLRPADIYEVSAPPAGGDSR